jgi:exodeoxyribonuclease-5
MSRSSAAKKEAPKLPPLPELSDEQAAAVEAIAAWFGKEKRAREPRFTLGGLAGTGKTTIVGHLIRRFEAKVCAFTGKAAHVLNTKGVPATTIHSLIYWCFQACEECGKAEGTCKCDGAVFKLRWSRVPDLGTKLVIVDEASMVNRGLIEDLESYGVPVLYVGDHGQLEPVGDDPHLMRAPDLRLETIHRQAAGSPIIRFAHHLRQGGDPEDFAATGELEVRRGIPDDLRPFDAILCGFNKTRVAVNAKVRRQLEHTGRIPQVGERAICLKNNKEHAIFNGMLATVTRATAGEIDVIDSMGTKFTKMAYLPEQFGAEQTLRDPPKGVTLWDFGYCLTVHKSQGSEFDRVLVLEQLAKIWEPARWRYTAATRAAKHETYCLPTRSR